MDSRTRTLSTQPIRTRLLQIGLEVVAVSGNDQCGWTLEAEDPPLSATRYDSIDELFFVLVNMSIAHEGTA